MIRSDDRFFSIFLVLVLGLLLCIRLSYCHIPFERDEGEYAYAGSLLLHGHLPYQDAYNMKFPGTYAMYALLMKIRGESIEAVRIGVFLLVAITLFGIGRIAYLLTRDLNAALLAAVVFTALTNTISGEGLMANSEHFVNLFVVFGILFLLRFTVEQKGLLNIFVSGLLLSCAVVMKQYGYTFCIFSFAVLFFNLLVRPLGYIIKVVFAFAIGLVIPVALLFLWIASNGLWQKFYFLTIQYALAYVNMARGNFGQAIGKISFSIPSLCALIIISLLVLLFSGRQKKGRFLLGWLVFAFIALSTGFYFRIHYFLLIYPVLGVITAFAYNRITVVFNKPAVNSVVAALLVLFFVINRNEQFASDRQNIYNQHYDWSMFAGMPAVAAHIDSLIPASDKLSLFSEEPELFFYSHHVAASGYIYTYPFFENQVYAQKMLDEYISQVEANPSRLFVYHSGSIQDDNPETRKRFEQWWAAYSKNFNLTGIYYATSATGGAFMGKEELEKNKDWQNYLRIEFWMKK